jgi:mannose/fructose-specific phosphotransferase system component IIA
MSRYIIAITHEDLAKKFNETVESLLQQMQLNVIQSYTLRAIRDSLLPRLMSGRIRVGMAR